MKASRLIPPLPAPELLAMANLTVIAFALMGTIQKEGTLFVPATFMLAAGTLAAPPLTVACWVRSKRDPANVMKGICTIGALFAVHITVFLWAIAASEMYDIPWPALAAGALQILTLMPYWKLFRRITKLLNQPTEQTDPL